MRIVEDKLDRKPKGFGYVEFASLDGLKTALSLSSSNLGGRSIRISVAEPRKSSSPIIVSGADFVQPKIVAMDVISVTGLARVLFQTYPAHKEGPQIATLVVATATSITCRMQAASVVVDVGMSRVTGRCEISPIGREEAHFLLPPLLLRP